MKTCTVFVKDPATGKMVVQETSLVPDDHVFGVIGETIHVAGSAEVLEAEDNDDEDVATVEEDSRHNIYRKNRTLYIDCDGDVVAHRTFVLNEKFVEESLAWIKEAMAEHKMVCKAPTN